MARSLASTLSAVLQLTLLCGLGAGCSDDECDIDGYTRDLAGIGAMGCNASPDAELISDCVSEQQALGKPFRAIFLHDDGGYHAIVGTGSKLYTQRSKGEGIEEAECTVLEPVMLDGAQALQCADPGSYATVCE